MMRRPLLLIVPLCGLLMAAAAGGVIAQEADLVIVKYGRLSVKSTVPDAKVYIDDTYKGVSDNVIENIMAGEHTISCRTDSKSVSGKFTITKDELLKLEARFDEGKLVAHVEHEKPEVVIKPEVEKKPKVAAPKPEKPKKPVVEVKKEERKSPEEERRALHLSILKAFFEDIDSQDVKITHKANPKVISKLTEKKSQSGTYYHTKQNVLLCDAGPCQQQWSASFTYTDALGNADSFSFTWKQVVFNGITPAGTSKRELLYCLNGVCKTMEDATDVYNPQAGEIGRYHVTWSKTSLVIRRSDIMKEVIAAGGLVEAY